MSGNSNSGRKPRSVEAKKGKDILQRIYPKAMKILKRKVNYIFAKPDADITRDEIELCLTVIYLRDGKPNVRMQHTIEGEAITTIIYHTSEVTGEASVDGRV